MNRERPTPPGEYECCESACSPCVWDTYYEDLHAWNAEQKALKEAQAQTQQPDNSEAGA
ncbi:oxidoreductase-like domain-containing protein [Aliamphritea hakodatensis]|uniref:oxidoreductase-like domain-containing protein n=1 Tax=Aliamphritea hakodatensis TaxID=2895352 RepID=UPI0022FD4C01|nr:oxidoreductase-like domain-containing protein [Aliamphritea hakodatensis]